MEVTIRRDERTAKGIDGNTYEIEGLIIRKDNGRDAFYGIDTKFCKANIFRRFKEQAIITEPGKIRLT